jgi:hypothetical protein
MTSPSGAEKLREPEVVALVRPTVTEAAVLGEAAPSPNEDEDCVAVIVGEKDGLQYTYEYRYRVRRR